MDSIINGKVVAKEILDDLKEKIEGLVRCGKSVPCIRVLLVEGDEPSLLYANQIVKKARKVGMDAKLLTFSPDFGTENLLSEVKRLNVDDTVSAIMIQFPLPKSYDSDAIRSAIVGSKDIDAIGTQNAGLFYSNKPAFTPCTAESMMVLLKSHINDLSGLKAVVLGRSHVVGRPVLELALRENMTVTICHSRTVNIEDEIKSADVVFSAIGSPNFVKKDMVKEGAIVIDAGINFVDGKLLGDVDYEAVSEIASGITPVPGGVGPVTNAILLRNVYRAHVDSLSHE